jgi:TolA-binding protein
LVVPLALAAVGGPGCMTTMDGRKLEASMADLRQTLDARPETDRQLEQAISDLTRAFDTAQARWASIGGGTSSTRMDAEIASLEARVDQLADEIRRQTQARTAASAQFEKRLAALEQSDAELADKVGLFIPDDKDELWRQGTALLASGHPDQGRRYCQAFVDRFPQDPRASQAYLAIGSSYLEDARYSNAAVAFQRLLALYPTSPEAPQAMWQLSRAFEGLSFCSDARSLLRDLVSRYPKSHEAADAMKQLRALTRSPRECVS